MKLIYFDSPAAFRDWLSKHHDSETELWVGFHKKATGKPTMTWSESVDEALCFGWIDGIRRKVDEERYTIRFTPRKQGSTWSNINLRKVDELIRAGRMRAAGLRAFKARSSESSGAYSFENPDAAKLDEKSEAEFRRNRKAWTFFQSQPPSYLKAVTWWVMSA